MQRSFDVYVHVPRFAIDTEEAPLPSGVLLTLPVDA